MSWFLGCVRSQFVFFIFLKKYLLVRLIKICFVRAQSVSKHDMGQQSRRANFQVPDRFQHSMGSTTGPCWSHIGPTLAPQWAHVGLILGPHWARIVHLRVKLELSLRLLGFGTPYMSVATMRCLERNLEAETQKRKEINLLDSRCRICFQSRERSRRELSNNKNNYLIIREQRRIMIMYWD
jgi:hypothetical protein